MAGIKQKGSDSIFQKIESDPFLLAFFLECLCPESHTVEPGPQNCAYSL